MGVTNNNNKENEMSESCVIKGEENTRRYQLVVLVKALQIHVLTGGQMRLTRADYIGLARNLGYKGRTAKSLLADILSKNPDLNRA
jgi:hypothetical protein